MNPIEHLPTRAGYLPSSTSQEPVEDRSCAAALGGNASTESDAWVGTTVGNYRILSVIASGGMGTVYRAEQLFPIRRDVALKMIKAGSADRKTVERFKVERQALALMDHPDIARVYEADSTSSGNPYFAMEFCDGQPIDQYCRVNRLNLKNRIELVVRIARAVSRAHSHGVVHRDLKPDNIIVSNCEGRPNLKVIDFGIAKLNEDCQRAESRDATRIGEIIGTPGYMSPEQAMGQIIDGRTDVFAIGAILFKVLTGTSPIAWQDSQPSVAEIIARIQSFEPERPSQRFTNLDSASKRGYATELGTTVAGYARTLKGDLDWITLRALEPNRTQRYASADDLADDLERYLRHEAVVAVAPSLGYRLKKYCQRRRSLVLSTTAVLCTLLVAGVILGFNWYSGYRKQKQELAWTSTEVGRLLAEAESARKIAAGGGPLADSSFLDAQTAVAQARTLLENAELTQVAELQPLSKQLELVESKMDLFRDAKQLSKALAGARDGAADLAESLPGDAFGRIAIREQVTEAFAQFGIAVADSDPVAVAAKLMQCPSSFQESIVEALDFMLTENPVGAGLFLAQQGGRLTVAEVVYDGASAAAGQIRVGDRLLGIGDVDLTERFSASEIASQAYRLLSAPSGTKLRLRFARTPTDVRECEVICGGKEATWAWKVLDSLDANPWRTKLRTAIIHSDMQTLRNLSKSELSEQNDAGLLQLANALVLWDRSNESIRFMQSVQEKYPANYWLNQLLGSALLNSHTPPRPEASARYLTAAVALRPNSVGARIELARTLSALGDKLQSSQQQEIASRLAPKINPDDRPFLVSRKDKAIDPNDSRQAATERNDSLTADENNSTVGSAIIEPERSKQSASNSILELSALELRCCSLTRSGERAEALSLILHAEKDGLDPKALRRAKAMVLLESKDYLAAKIMLAELVRVLPDDPVCRLYFAFALSELGDVEPAVEQCEAALKLQPDFARARELRNVLLNR